MLVNLILDLGGRARERKREGEKGREACADEVKVERGSTGRKMREIDEGTMCLERKE